MERNFLAPFQTSISSIWFPLSWQLKKLCHWIQKCTTFPFPDKVHIALLHKQHIGLLWCQRGWNYIVFDGTAILLFEALVAFHSIVPLYWVSKYLIDYLNCMKRDCWSIKSWSTVRRRNGTERIKQRIHMRKCQTKRKPNQFQIHLQPFCEYCWRARAKLISNITKVDARKFISFNTTNK